MRLQKGRVMARQVRQAGLPDLAGAGAGWFQSARLSTRGARQELDAAAVAAPGTGAALLPSSSPPKPKSAPLPRRLTLAGMKRYSWRRRCAVCRPSYACRGGQVGGQSVSVGRVGQGAAAAGAAALGRPPGRASGTGPRARPASARLPAPPPPTHLEVVGVGQQLALQLHQRARHGGGEEQRLARRRQRRQDARQLRLERRLQQAVRLVQHLHGRQAGRHCVGDVSWYELVWLHSHRRQLRTAKRCHGMEPPGGGSTNQANAEHAPGSGRGQRRAPGPRPRPAAAPGARAWRSPRAAAATAPWPVGGAGGRAGGGSGWRRGPLRCKRRSTRSAGGGSRPDSTPPARCAPLGRAQPQGHTPAWSVPTPQLQHPPAPACPGRPPPPSP